MNYGCGWTQCRMSKRHTCQHMFGRQVPLLTARHFRRHLPKIKQSRNPTLPWFLASGCGVTGSGPSVVTRQVLVSNVADIDARRRSSLLADQLKPTQHLSAKPAGHIRNEYAIISPHHRVTWSTYKRRRDRLSVITSRPPNRCQLYVMYRKCADNPLNFFGQLLMSTAKNVSSGNGQR